MKLKDKVAVVTGSGAGIGQSIVEEFAGQGAKVAAVSRRALNGQPVVDAVKQKGGEAVFIQCDVSSEDQVKQMIQKTLEALRPPGHPGKQRRGEFRKGL